MKTITENNGYGKELNKVWAKWVAIKTEKQHAKWGAYVAGLRFGTYEQYSILDIVEFSEPTYPNAVLEKNFLSELKTSIKNTQYDTK